MYPLALLGLAAIPGLVVIYLMQNRYRRHPVSALFLWQTLSRSREGGSRIRRMSLPLLFFLELLLAALLIGAAVDTRYRRRGTPVPLLVVLDDSLSMQAEDGGSRARDRALDALRAEMDDLKPTSVRLILAGERPRPCGPARSPEAIGADIALWRCVSPSADIEGAVALAFSLATPGTRILVLTDTPAESEDGHGPASGRLRRVACGRALPNAGFFNAARTPADPATDRCLLEITNPSATALKTGVTIRDETGNERRQALDLGPGETRKLVLAVPVTGGTLTARLDDDALSADNRVDLLPPPRRVPTRANAIRDPELAAAVTDAAEAVGMPEAAPGTADILFTDEMKGAPGADRWIVRFRIPGTPRAYTGPFVVDQRHPLTEGLSPEGVIWGAGEPADKLPGLPVIMAGNAILAADLEHAAGGRTISVSLAPAASNLQRSPNWPILFWNLMAWRAQHLPGIREAHVRPGDTVILLLPPGADPEADAGVVLCPDGSRVPLPAPRDRRISFEARATGPYTIRTDDGTEYRFACNPLVPGETDLTRCAAQTTGDWSNGEQAEREEAGTATALGLLALAVFGFHTLAVRRMTQR